MVWLSKDDGTDFHSKITMEINGYHQRSGYQQSLKYFLLMTMTTKFSFLGWTVPWSI